MYIRRINKGGSLLVCANAPKEGKNNLKSARRWRGQVYHVPSLKYLLGEDASDDQVDVLNNYFDSLRVGQLIDWDIPTTDPVYFTQDRNGNDIEPRKSTRLYADIDLDKLDDAIEASIAPAQEAPAPARRARGAKA
jgi:hypothetical protein